MPKKPQNKIRKTALKHYNQFRSVRTEALRWLQIARDTGLKFKVETTAKEIYEPLLEFIIIDVLEIEQRHSSSQDIISISMTTIINRSFNKHPIP